jgi:hypothetical protein
MWALCLKTMPWYSWNIAKVVIKHQSINQASRCGIDISYSNPGMKNWNVSFDLGILQTGSK